jgi:hypothetical protein
MSCPHSTPHLEGRDVRSTRIAVQEEDSALDRLATAATLIMLERFVCLADGVLAGAPERGLSWAGDSQPAREAERILTEVEDVLARLAGDAGVDESMARKLLAVRDELGGHLLAVARVEGIDLPSHVIVGILRRAAETTRDGLRAVIPDSSSRTKRELQQA